MMGALEEEEAVVDILDQEEVLVLCLETVALQQLQHEATTIFFVFQEPRSLLLLVRV